MMADQVTRSAARVALLVAVPVALLAGLVVFAAMGGLGRDEPPRPPRAQSTGPVAMPAPALAERPAAVCRALMSRLPEGLRELSRRPVSAGPEQNAAYGEPAITVSCGGSPASYPRDAFFWKIKNMCWYAETRAPGTAWTTLDREVPVTVLVPDAYQGPGDWVAGLTDRVLATVPAAQPPAGC